jgi:hypothetical protein
VLLFRFNLSLIIEREERVFSGGGGNRDSYQCLHDQAVSLGLLTNEPLNSKGVNQPGPDGVDLIKFEALGIRPL